MLLFLLYRLYHHSRGSPGKQCEIRQKNTPEIKFVRKLAYGVLNILFKHRIEIMGMGKMGLARNYRYEVFVISNINIIQILFVINTLKVAKISP